MARYHPVDAAARGVRYREGGPQGSMTAVLVAERDRALAERDRALAERDRLQAERDKALVAQAYAQEALTELRESAAPADALQRLAADLANVRRRQAEEIRMGVGREQQRLLLEVAGLRDSIDAALRTSKDPNSPWHQGLVALNGKVEQLFAKESVEIFGQADGDFDPELHEALATVPGKDEGRIVEVVECGLRFKDGRLLRPARVVVGAG